MQQVEVITCLPSAAREVLAAQVKLTADIPGDLAELGVYKGGSASIIAENKREEKTLHLFDTFCGLPQPQAEDVGGLRRGDFGDTTLARVQFKLSGFPNVTFHQGLFWWTSRTLYANQWSFAHLDCDLFESTSQGLSYFYPRMNPGGIILLDDVGRPNCPGVELALIKFMEDKKEEIEIVGDGQARIVKL